MSGESYRSYLLRLWKSVDGKGVQIALEEVETGQSHAFSDLDRFHRWLARETNTTRTPSQPAGNTKAP
jgi:hypothetical protein